MPHVKFHMSARITSPDMCQCVSVIWKKRPFSFLSLILLSSFFFHFFLRPSFGVSRCGYVNLASEAVPLTDASVALRALLALSMSQLLRHVFFFWSFFCSFSRSISYGQRNSKGTIIVFFVFFESIFYVNFLCCSWTRQLATWRCASRGEQKKTSGPSSWQRLESIVALIVQTALFNESKFNAIHCRRDSRAIKKTKSNNQQS